MPNWYEANKSWLPEDYYQREGYLVKNLPHAWATLVFIRYNSEQPRFRQACVAAWEALEPDERVRLRPLLPPKE